VSPPPHDARLLLLDASGAGAESETLVAVMDGPRLVGACRMPGRGAAERISSACYDLLGQAGWPDGPDAIVAVTGPGSFTGLRASLSLARGLAMGYGCASAGVTLGAALRHMDGAAHAWTLSAARRGRLFVDDGQRPPFAIALDDFELPDSCLAIMGDAAEWMTTRAVEPMRLPYRQPTPAAIRDAYLAGAVSPLRPLYIDPPEAKPPRDGLRPSPVMDRM